MSLRRGQFTLGLMILALVAAGVVMGVWRYATREARAIAEIERLGGRVIDGEDDFGQFRGVHLVGGDAALAQLPYVTGVQSLYVDPVDVTDAGMVFVGQLVSLEDLSLHNCQITDAGLARLAGLKSLVTLGIDHTQVTDAGMQHLAAFRRLQVLDLSGDSVGNAGVDQLHGLTALERIDLDGTRVDDDGKLRLREALPDLNIEK